VKGLVPDTNVWLHGKEPLDFGRLADGDAFVVVVPRRVITELDDLQHEGRATLRKRARQEVMRLRRVLNTGAQVEGGVEATDADGVTYRLVLDATAPPGSSADDVIVATAASLKSSFEPIVVTSDAAMQMTAKLAGLPVRILADDELEPDDADATEQKLAALERQVKILKEPQPLIVEVVMQPLWPEGNPPGLVRLSQPSAEELEDLRRQVQIGMQPAPRGPGVMPVGQREYLEALPGHAAAVAEYMRDRSRWEASAEAGVQVQVLLVNRTSHPVEEAVLELTAPPHVSFLYPPPKPEPPRPPEKPQDAAVLAALRCIRLPLIPALDTSFMVPPVRPIATHGPRVRTEDPWAELRPGEPLRPDHEAYAGRLWIGLEPEFDGTEIVFPYTIYAATPGKPASGTARLTVSWKLEAWVAPTLPTYSEPNIPEIERQDQRVRQSEAEDAERKGRRGD